MSGQIDAAHAGPLIEPFLANGRFDPVVDYLRRDR
jgi:hypothetical protein